MGTADTNQATSGLAGVSTAAPEVGSLAALSEKYKTGDEVAWKKEQQALASEPDWLDRLAYGMEAFGAGYKGQEPLYLKVRRQQMLEDQQRQEQQTKLLQMHQQKMDSDRQTVVGVLTGDMDAKQKEEFIKIEVGRGNEYAKSMQPVLNNKRLAQAKTLLKYMDPDFATKFSKDPRSVEQDELEANITAAERVIEAKKADAAEEQQFKRIYSELGKKPGDVFTKDDILKLPPTDYKFVKTWMTDMTKREQDAEKSALELSLLRNRAAPDRLAAEDTKALAEA